MSESYEQFRAKKAQEFRDESASGREIADKYPDVENPARKERCRRNLKLFCRTYFPNRFFLPFASPHNEAIARLEECEIHGGRFCCAMPRGTGKDTLVECAIIHALGYGWRKFAVLIGATEKHATRSLKKIMAEFETNDLLLADFPEIVYPIRRLDRIAHRARGQTFNGVHTRIEWTSDGLVLPTIPDSVAMGSAGSTVQVVGLTGAVRGMTIAGPDGQPIRPDLVLLNDCQTHESAKHPTQTADRESIINNDVLMLAGPTTNIAVVMLCTVIYKNDLSDRYLDPEKYPDWQKVRTKMLETFPKNMPKWDEYSEVRRDGLRLGDRGKRGNAYYRANRQELDEGGIVSWPQRKKKGELSGLQSAMNLFYDNPRGFFAECQNDPQAEDLAQGAKELIPAEVGKRTSGLDRCVVPREATRLTAFIDCGQTVLWYVVTGWNESFGGSVIDYGCWPPQNRSHFAKYDARPNLEQRYSTQLKPMKEAQWIYAGLNELTPHILGRPYHREQSNDEVRVERCLIDSGYESNAVYQFIRQSPFASILYASKGIGRTYTSAGIAGWKRRPGERIGHHWRLTLSETGRGRMVQFDPDAWKSVVYSALSVPLGGKTGISLFGTKPGTHEMFAEHCGAEYSEPKLHRGTWFDKWSVRPDRQDNDLFDCLVGSAVAASVAGVQLTTTDEPVPAKPVRQKIDFKAKVEAARAAGGRR